MNRWRWIGLGCAGLAVGMAATGWTDCEYVLKNTRVMQCEPIQLKKNDAGDDVWVFVEPTDVSKAETFAHILCYCDTVAKTGSSDSCEPKRTRKLTFTRKTQNISKTCFQPDLCKDTCLQLMQSAPPK